MTKLRRTITSAISAGALILNTAVPVFAQTTIEISGNGADSINTAGVSVTNTTTVSQYNDANITNSVNASSNTGGNSASKNTGGSVSVETGDAETTVGVANTVNSNSAEVDCCQMDADVLISGNGADSKNNVDLGLKNTTVVYQDNNAKIKNTVYADSNTGDNRANKNTGGDVSIQTGDASTGVGISNMANSNWVNVGGNGNGGSVSLRILGNGADSKNEIKLDLLRSLIVSQYNDADIRNRVDASSNTGDNRANKNTGGDVEIETGDATTEVGIDNLVNFNWADLDCGCLLDVLAKISGNGADSKNTIKAKMDDVKVVYQDNNWDCKKHGRWGEWWDWKKGKDCNTVVADSDTGGNKAKENTGDPEGDPSVETGDAETVVEIENSGNVNVVGDSSGFDFPELPDFDFDFGFNFSFFWLWLSGMLG